jgi:GNAT superfamily N-acetyltransferase
VPRSPVEIHAATLEDIPTLLTLWDELRDVGGRTDRGAALLAPGDVERRFADLIQSPGFRVMLAVVANEPAGMAVLQVIHPDPMSDEELVRIGHMVVTRGNRHRGVGHALIQAATDFAIEQHIDFVAVGVSPSMRDTSRFFARLGFAPASLHRVASVGPLRRRLAPERQLSAVTGDRVRRRRIPRPVPPQRRQRPAEPIDNAS